MKIKITIPSSIEESVSTLTVKNVREGDDKEVLLTISSPCGDADIYVLLSHLRKALEKID